MSTDLRDVASLISPVATYQESIADTIAVLQNLTTEQWTLDTPCPGWSIADIAAHLIDLDSMAIGAPKPDHSPDWDTLPHVSSPFQQFTEVGVDQRRGTSPEELLRQLTEASNQLIEFLEHSTAMIKVPWAKSELPLDQFLSMRSFDVWVHEQDIRSAIQSPGNMNTNPARNAAQRMINSLPLIWGKKIAAPPGSELIFTLAGPGVEGTVNIAVSPEGRAEFVEQVGDSADRVTMSWPDFAHAFAGRVPVAESIARAQIDGELAKAFVAQLASTP
jgi:uncharacterized protein (TIGR03083 family)